MRQKNEREDQGECAQDRVKPALVYEADIGIEEGTTRLLLEAFSHAM